MVQTKHNCKFITPYRLPVFYNGISMYLQAETPHNFQTPGRCWFKFQMPVVEDQCLRCSAESGKAFANLLWGKTVCPYQPSMNEVISPCYQQSSICLVNVYWMSLRKVRRSVDSGKRPRGMGYIQLKSSKYTLLLPYQLFIYLSTTSILVG